MRKKTLLFPLIIFIVLAIFFICFHPVAILDTDDWTNIHQRRLPIPVINAWNPIKVFPEIFMSVVSYAGAYLIYPFLGRYVFSLSIANGLFICFILTIYFSEFHLLISSKNSLPNIQNVFATVFFICLHFIIVAHPGSDNLYLFYSLDLTCIYHYTLSTIINAALVMHMIRYGGYHNFGLFSKKHKLLVLTWTYFAIFSSLYTNMIIAIYVGVELLFALINDCSEHSFKFPEFVKRHKPHLIVLFIWLSSLLFESTGGRSGGKEDDFLTSLGEAFANIATWVKSFNLCFIILFCVVIVLWSVLVNEKNTGSAFRYFLAFVLTTLYIVLLSSVVNSSYVTRVDVMIASDFWLLLIMMLALCRIVSIIKSGDKILAGLALVAVVITFCVIGTYQESNYINLPYNKCEALAEDVIAQFKTAEQNGEKEFDLVVPDFGTENNWPYNLAQSDDFSKALYRHNITKEKIDVRTMILSADKYSQFIE